MIDPSIRARLDEHMIAAQSIRYRTIPGGAFEIMPHWLRGFSGSEQPTFNIFQPLFPAALNDDLLADTAAYFYSKDALYAIEIVHDRLPKGPDFLDQRRYQPLPPQPAMVLSQFPTTENVSINPDVELEHVHSVPLLTAFCTLLHEVFDFSLADTTKLFPVAHLEGETRHIIRHYLAFLDEQPVGAGTIICQKGMVSIWNVCVADSYRQQGVAVTLLQHMLQAAQENGCDLAMLYATPQAFRLFSKLGFDIYTQRQWFLPPGLTYLE